MVLEMKGEEEWEFERLEDFEREHLEERHAQKWYFC